MGLNLQEACFVKWGCDKCQQYRDDYFRISGKYIDCKDKELSYKEKVKKIEKKYEKE